MRSLLLIFLVAIITAKAVAGFDTAELRNLWAPACDTTSLVTVALPSPTGAKVTVQARAASFFRRMHDIMYAWNWDPPKETTGAYNCRQITGGTGYSLHAYGIAGDYDWNSNPYGPTLITNMDRGMVDEILAIRTVGGDAVFRWGGDYQGSNKDAMHYEIIASPDQLATGLQDQTCNANGVDGQCVHTSRCDESGVADICAGAATLTYTYSYSTLPLLIVCTFLRCCTGTVSKKRSSNEETTTFGSCTVSGVTGVCRDESTCSGIVTAGLCPGGREIKCCTSLDL